MKAMLAILSLLTLSSAAQTNDVIFLNSAANSLIEIKTGRVGIKADVATDALHYASSPLDTADLLSSGNLHYAVDGLSLRLILEYEFTERFAIGAFAEVSDLRLEQDLTVGGFYLAFKFGHACTRSVP